MGAAERQTPARRVRLELDRAARAARRRLRAGVRRARRQSRTPWPLVQRHGGAAPRAPDARRRAGDEVLTSTLTFAATANADHLRRRRRRSSSTATAPPGTWTRRCWPKSCERLRQAGRLPKAVIAVDLYGQCADYDADPSRPARATTCPLIEDAAEALGATYDGRPAGTFGALGGLLLQRQQDHHHQRRRHARLRRRGAGPTAPASSPRRPAIRRRTTSTRRSATTTGMSNLLAAVGPRAAARARRARRAAARELRLLPRRRWATLPGIDVHARAPRGRSTRWLTCITVDPERVRRHAGRHPPGPGGARTSSPGPSGSRCTCSRSSSGCRVRGGTGGRGSLRARPLPAQRLESRGSGPPASL